MTAWGEFRLSWSNLLGTCFGLGTGAALSFYTMSIFGPALIADLGWSRADFALVGSLSLITMPILPFTGRFIDRVGPRIAGTAGFTVLTLCFIALSMMSGEFWHFLAIQFFLGVFGVMTSSMAFARVIVDRFDHARGLALSIMMSASPLSGAIAAPLIGGVIAEHGWRSGYLVLAAISAVGGLLTVALIGRSGSKTQSDGKANAAKAAVKFTRAEFLTIVRNPVFPILIVGMFLVNVPQVLAQSQLKLVIMGTGVPGEAATWMVSLYAIGVVVGRCGCGIALDRVKTHIVAFITLGLPTISYVLLAGEVTATAILVPAILLIGPGAGRGRRRRRLHHLAPVRPEEFQPALRLSQHHGQFRIVDRRADSQHDTAERQQLRPLFHRLRDYGFCRRGAFRIDRAGRSWSGKTRNPRRSRGSGGAKRSPWRDGLTAPIFD